MTRTTTQRPLKLDLGSGASPRKGFKGVDRFTPGRNIIQLDLFKFPWPFDTEGVDEVWCSHFIEHVPAPYMGMDGDMVYPWCDFMNEVWRILKVGSMATFIHPALQSVRAFQDPTHCQFIPAERWLYVNQEQRAKSGLDHLPYPSCNFEIVEGGTHAVADAWELRTEEARGNAMAWYWNVAGDIVIKLKKLAKE